MKNRKELREKIFNGVKLALERLFLVSQQNNDYLVFSEKGKIVKVKARKLKKYHGLYHL